MSFFKRTLSFVLAFSFAAALSLPVFAVGAGEQSDADARVLQVLVVDENGGRFYIGEEAEKVFAELDSAKTPASAEKPTVDADKLPADAVESFGAFRYNYRFVPDSKDLTRVYGSYSIISDALENVSSLTQKAPTIITAEASWSVNDKLTGWFKAAAEAAVGGDWDKACSGGLVLDISVAPDKRVWVQYRPEYILRSGNVQKYYTTRGTGITIVEASQKAEVYEPYYGVFTLNNQTYKLPAGIYVWCEDSNCLSPTPPMVKQ